MCHVRCPRRVRLQFFEPPRTTPDTSGSATFLDFHDFFRSSFYRYPVLKIQFPGTDEDLLLEAPGKRRSSDILYLSVGPNTL